MFTFTQITKGSFVEFSLGVVGFKVGALAASRFLIAFTYDVLQAHPYGRSSLSSRGGEGGF